LGEGTTEAAFENQDAPQAEDRASSLPLPKGEGGVRGKEAIEYPRGSKDFDAPSEDVGPDFCIVNLKRVTKWTSGRARHSVRAVLRRSKPRRARSDAPYPLPQNGDYVTGPK